MAVKHKVLKDFQLLTQDKKIITLKAKTVLEDYKYITKNDNVIIEKDVIDNNPDFFSTVDWKEELNTYLRQNKIPQPAVLTKKLSPFIEEMFVSNQQVEVKEVIKESTNLEKEIELENKIQKNTLLEQRLKLEVESVNQLQLELEKKEKMLNEKELNLNSQASIIELEKLNLEKRNLELNNREYRIKEKEDNHVDLIDRQEIINKFDSELNNIRLQGFNDDFTNTIKSIVNNIIQR